MSKFKKGDRVYLDKRGMFGIEDRDWSMSDLPWLNNPRLEKNKLYTINGIASINRVRLEGYIIHYHEDHFKLYEQV